MILKQQIKTQLTEALKNKEELTISVLRMLLGAITNVEIQKKKRAEGLSDEEVIEVISREVKQREDSITEYTKGRRFDLVDKEKKEKNILKKYLPTSFREDELKNIIQKTIQSLGATDPSQLGQVMSKIMPQVKGRADGALVNQLVKNCLDTLNLTKK